jgi:hypothetical protein
MASFLDEHGTIKKEGINEMVHEFLVQLGMKVLQVDWV